jgi:YCII-related domain
LPARRAADSTCPRSGRTRSTGTSSPGRRSGRRPARSSTAARSWTRSARPRRSPAAPDGRPVVTDGPYLELKEVIGGLILVEADDIDDAVNVAADWPTLAEFGDKIEVRPVLEQQ